VCLDNSLIARACPLEMIDQIGGWKSVSPIGNSYGKRYCLRELKKYLEKICFFTSPAHPSSW
jgi:hypothetical protein